MDNQKEKEEEKEEENRPLWLGQADHEEAGADEAATDLQASCIFFASLTYIASQSSRNDCD